MPLEQDTEPASSGALGKTGFDYLLESLDPDREEAGKKYVRLQAQLAERLAPICRTRNLADPNTLADTVLDRIGKRLATGEIVLNLTAYAQGVARYVEREMYRQLMRYAVESLDAEESKVQQLAVNESSPEKLLILRAMRETERGCYRKCFVTMLKPEQQTFFSCYFLQEFSADERKNLLGFDLVMDGMRVDKSANTVRQQASRMWKKVMECCLDCIDSPPAAGGQHRHG